MMSTRLAILELTHRHRLDAATLASLWRIARLGEPPPQLPALMRRGVGMLAALLAGLGLIFLVAANLDALSRLQKFVLLQGCTAAVCLGAAFLPRMRTPLALLGLLAIGGLFAYFGQTYQTGADPWQLFALWAVLALPLALGARSDTVWSAWVIVAMTGLTTWDAAQSGGWRFAAEDLGVHLLAALLATAIAVLMSQALVRFSGAGKVSFNLAVLLATISVTGAGMLALFERGGGALLYYLLSLVILGAGAACLAQRTLFDVTALSVLALGLIVLLDAGLLRLLDSGGSGEGILLVSGLAAVGLMAAAMRCILALSREYGSGGKA